MALTTLELLEKAAAELRASQEENNQLKLQIQEAISERQPAFVAQPIEVQAAHIGANIQRLRKERGYSTGGFATLCRRSPQTISNIENNRARASWVVLLEIANVLEVPLFEAIVNSPSVDCEEQKQAVNRED